MNKRQKKKLYKKLYGHNPPKGPDGRYVLHLRYEPDQTERPMTEEYEKKVASDYKDIFSNMAKTIYDCTERIIKILGDFVEQCKEMEIEKGEEPNVVTARKLSERRCKRWQNGHRRTWKR